MGTLFSLSPDLNDKYHIWLSVQWETCCIVIYMQDTYWHNNIDERHSLLEKYISHFIWKACVWEGVGDRTELQYIDPHSYGHRRCVFLVPQGCSTGGLGALSAGCWFSLPNLVTNGSPNLIGGPKGPFCRVVAFSPTSCLLLILSSTHWLPVFPELYNSSIAFSIFGMACLIVIKRK